MKPKDRVNAFAVLGDKIDDLSESELTKLGEKTQTENIWFTLENTKTALSAVAYMLKKVKLEKWIPNHTKEPKTIKYIGIIMPGNIPLAGFHDLLCVLLSGHCAVLSPSTKNTFLIKKAVQWILEIAPELKKQIQFKNQFDKVDAIIATGSDNTARYFEYHFKNIPSIIRKNRASVAVLDGDEKTIEKHDLGKDIFLYFGLGCRSVSKIFISKNFDLHGLVSYFESYKNIIHHPKYRNNYEYCRAIFKINNWEYTDTGFFFFTNHHSLFSPIAVLHVEEYDSQQDLMNKINNNTQKIQCIISKKDIPFGKAHYPDLWNYADNINTLDFLQNLSK